MKRVLLVALMAFGSGGCVKAYEREYLSLRAMRPASESTEDKFRAHWQSSREGSEGGFGAAGGGCGCN
ncbi:MAG: hypothetical protein JWN44_85 [Myxococcales bacterium]|nr:hypothetical protein [Myxococcales bacterium]